MASYLVNTTFLAAPEAEAEFLEWMKSRYIPEVNGSDVWHSPLFNRIMSETGADGKSYALQMQTDSLESARLWYETGGAALIQEMTDHFGENVLFFITEMEVIE